jgi:hypothetical protein
MDKVRIRNVKSESLKGKPLSTKWPAKWRAVSLLSIILLCVAALCAILINGAAKVESPETVRATQPPPAGPRQLLAAQPSPEALARRFLDALAKEDLGAMRELRITREEFCQYIWPELPSSRIPNVTCDWAWSQATLKSEGGLYKLLPPHKGKRYELVSVQFLKGVDKYPSYKVLKETQLVVKDEHGQQKEVRLFGSMLEMNGQFKLFSFVID